MSPTDFYVSLLRIVHNVIVERFEGGQWLRGDVISTLFAKVESDYVQNAPGAMMCVLKKFHCIIYVNVM